MFKWVQQVVYHVQFVWSAFTVNRQGSRNTTHRTFREACGIVCVVVVLPSGQILVSLRTPSAHTTTSVCQYSESCF